MAPLSLSQASFGAPHTLLDIFADPPDLLISALEKLGEGKLHMLCDSFHLSKALFSGLLKKRLKHFLVQPGGCLWS